MKGEVGGVGWEGVEMGDKVRKGWGEVLKSFKLKVWLQ